MRRYMLRFLLVAIVFTGVNAKADGLSFNELQLGEDVLEYYNGGFGGAGSGPGPALGISFTSGLIAVAGDVYGEPDGKAAELDSPEVIMNVFGGFSGLVQFYVLGGPIDVAFYDELDGLGNLVGTISSPGSDVVGETLPEFHSAVFSGTPGTTRIDPLLFGPPGGPLLLPEPSALLLLATGIGLVCILLRRKTQWNVVKMSRATSIPRTILGVALPLGIAIFSTIARADEIPLYRLLTEPNASISVGSLRFSNFGFFSTIFPDFPPGRPEEMVYYCENLPQAPFCEQTVASFQRNGDNGLGSNAGYESSSFIMMVFDVTSSVGLQGMTIAFDVEPVPKPGDPGDTFAAAYLFPSFNNGVSAGVEACTGEAECPDGDRFVSQTSFLAYNPQTGRMEPTLLSQAHVQVEVFIGDISLRGASASTITHWDITFAEVPEPGAGLLFACAAGKTMLLTRRWLS